MARVLAARGARHPRRHSRLEPRRRRDHAPGRPGRDPWRERGRDGAFVRNFLFLGVMELDVERDPSVEPSLSLLRRLRPQLRIRLR